MHLERVLLAFLESSGRLLRDHRSHDDLVRTWHGYFLFFFGGEDGLLSVAFPPNYSAKNYFYVYYIRIGDETSVVSRFSLSTNANEADPLSEQVLLEVPRSSTSLDGGLLLFGPDGYLYVGIGDTGFDQGVPNRAQDPGSLRGKILRIDVESSLGSYLVPTDNPFVGKAGARPEIFTIGHRDHHGLAANPATGQMFEGELGPMGGDKINILKPGANYGWPNVGYGRDNDGSPMPPPGEGIEPAWITWNPGITPSGLLFYTGDKFPAWKGNILVGSIQRGKTPGTGAVERIVFNDKMWEQRRETILQDLHQRVRDVRQGPDGLIYILTEEDDGAVIRIEPAP